MDILYGSTSPSGKLPYTIAKQASDYGSTVSSGNDDTWDLFIDYRRFDQQKIAPRFEFGFGLCKSTPNLRRGEYLLMSMQLAYTNFTYTDLAVTGTPTSGPATGKIAPGGPADLFETVATVTATITNSGGVAGAEAAQLYLGYPSSAPSTPPKQLRGFTKLKLDKGASGKATFALRRRDLSYWDGNAWVVPTGYVGASSRDVRLTGKITV